MGVDLYSVQQDLARNQMSVEQQHDDYAKRQKHRLQAEQELSEMRVTYTGKQKLIKMERKKGGAVGVACVYRGSFTTVKLFQIAKMFKAYHNKLPQRMYKYLVYSMNLCM